MPSNYKMDTISAIYCYRENCVVAGFDIFNTLPSRCSYSILNCANPPRVTWQWITVGIPIWKDYPRDMNIVITVYRY